jgi:uncharacterized membrane protein
MSGRRASLDWARGLAVLLMIVAHTSDAWTRAADRGTSAYGVLTILGGFAAPLFLWLAGVGVAISAARTAGRTSRAQAAESIARRGLEIFLLAFLFRLQAFVVSPGSHPVTLFRVDILNVMGPAIAIAGVLWAISNRASVRVGVLGAAAVAIAMITPVVRAAAAVDRLPTWVQWYVRPAGEHTTFTLLPWAGFVFAGAAAGTILSSLSSPGRSDAGRAPAILGPAGAALVALGFYSSTLPSIYASSSFWTSSPTWFAIRTGVVMLAVWLLVILESRSIPRALRPAFDALARFGQASLFVYWIHVELVYGYASWLWRGRLPVWLTVCALAAFSALMYRAVIARDRYRARKPTIFVPPPALGQA